MKGRRLTDPQNFNVKLWNQGDYFGPLIGYTGPVPAVFYKMPLPGCQRHIHHVVSPPHTFRECADGSLEIRASIGHKKVSSCDGADWHGYLDEGNNWRTV